MTRRLFGPVSGPIAFFLVAALVFAGLGWVTYSALGVERSQRESAARAEMGNNLRVALWQLDSRMLPALGVEDSRPYYHYAPPDPAATPLFVANLADWMKLHFQLDPADRMDVPAGARPGHLPAGTRSLGGSESAQHVLRAGPGTQRSQVPLSRPDDIRPVRDY